MNRSEFKAYVAETRDCDSELLDIAVKKGLNRAKYKRPDFRSFMKLAAMCAVTAVVCFLMSLEPIGIGTTDFRISNCLVTQDGSEVLYDSLHTVTKGITELLRAVDTS